MDSIKFLPYTKYLQTPHWKKTRDEKLSSVGGKCEKCGKRSKSLHVHHLNYTRKGEELLSDLQVLCKACHGKTHSDAKVEDEARLKEVSNKNFVFEQNFAQFLIGKMQDAGLESVTTNEAVAICAPEYRDSEMIAGLLRELVRRHGWTVKDKGYYPPHTS